MTPIPDHWFHRIKAATRDLIKLCGGLERAAGVAALSTSALSRSQCAAHGDIISIPAALALEAECGANLITAAMAGLHGCRLATPEDDAIVAARAFAGVAEAMRGASELMAASAEAAADGKLSPAEAERLDRAASTIESTITPLRRTLAAAKGARAGTEAGR
jgi:hypothetical protein